MKRNRIQRILSIFSLALLGLFIPFLPLSDTLGIPNESWTENVVLPTQAYTDYVTVYHPFSDVYLGVITANVNHIYVIETAEDLYQFSQFANGVDRTTYLSLHYVLGDDIDYSAASGSGKFFRPVGFLPNPSPDPQKTAIENQAANPLAFQGTFDGQGFEILNLVFESIGAIEYQSVYQNVLTHYSMFSVLGEDGIVQNVGFINPIMIQPLNYGIMNYASVVVGANHGNLNHVYVIDNRATADAGLNVNGAFHLAGAVVQNYGTMADVFVAVPRVKSAAVTTNTSTSIVLTENFGTLTRVYYDVTIYAPDTPSPTELGTALATSAFQTSAYFDAAWFYNATYLSANNPNNTYPILKGFARYNSTLYVKRAADLLYMAEMFDKNIGFQTLNYQVFNDIDMASVSRFAYAPPAAAFTNTFESRTISTNPTGILYTREVGENVYFTILNLSITKGTDLGIFAGYGIFGFLSGTVRNLNILAATLTLSDHESFLAEDFISAGIVAARQTGTISNVHVIENASIPAGEMTKVYLGGLVGSGTGTITLSSTTGNLYGGTHVFNAKSKDTALGGFIGYAGVPGSTAATLNINNSTNRIDLVGPGFTASDDSLTDLGGFVGTGYITSFVNLTNEGDITSHPDDAYLDSVFMGGIIGYLTWMNSNNTSNVVNNGTVTLVVNQSQRARLGIGFGVGANTVNFTARTYTNVVNHGAFVLDIPVGVTFTEADLAAMDIQMAGIIVAYNMQRTTFTRFVNDADIEIDLSFIQEYAGILHANQNYYATETETDFRFRYNNAGTSYIVGTSASSYTTTLTYSSNTGNITATTSEPIYRHQLKLSGVALGKGSNFFYIRNEGDISVDITEDAPYELDTAPTTDGVVLQKKNIIILGVMEEVYNAKRATALYNGGHLSFVSDPTKDVRFNVFMSGILYRNKNTVTTSPATNVSGLLNDGYVTADAAVKGTVRASGIVNVSLGCIQSAINAGDIYVKNAVKENTTGNVNNDFLVDAGGIAGMQAVNSSSAILMNVANYGDVVAYSTTSHGRATAAGILVRNNRREDQVIISSSADNYTTGQIRHAINYGKIYAWNERTDTLQVKDETYAIAGGILGIGLLRIDTTINYGDIYAKTLSGGIVGHLDFYDFARYLNPSTVYLANLINYGSVRRITAATAFSFSTANGIAHNAASVSGSTTANGNQAQGGILGNIYVGTSDWNFSSGNSAFNTTRYRQWLNFDPLTDILGNAPPTSLTNDTLAANLSALAYAIKSPDNSGYPYNSVASYTLDDTATGVFNAAFPFMAPATTTPALLNYIGFIPTNRVNYLLLEEIGFDFDPNDLTKGLFALGPSTGIGSEGLYIPDNFDLDALNPYLGDGSWRNVVNSGGETLNHKVASGMKQLSESLATNIVNAQLVDNVTSPTLRILNPVIDLVNYTITYYVANNSTFAADANKTSSSENAYLAAAANLTAYGAYLDGSTWRGTHVWSGTSYVAQAGGTHVLVPVTIFSSTTPTSFYVNTTETATFSLGYRASFYYEEGNPAACINLPATIQNSYGPYDASGELRDVNGNLLDSVLLHSGTIRVYSEAYNYDPLDPDADPITYRDYQVNIVRLEDMAYTAVSALTVDSVAQTPTYTDVHDVDATAFPLYFKPVSTTQGRFVLTYATINVPYGATPHMATRLLNSSDTVMNYGTYYTLAFTNNQTVGGLNVATNTWAPSTATYTLAITQVLPAGDYTFEVRIGDADIYEFHFTKMISTDALITTIQTTSQTISASGLNWITALPYGMYYVAADTSTRIMEFSNLNTISEIPAASVNTTLNRPSYLTSLAITPFATLVSVDVTINPVLVDGYRHEYIVRFVIRSEAGVETERTHTITERALSPAVTAAYWGVNPLEAPYATQSFEREENPNYKYEYGLTYVYKYQNVGLTPTLTYYGSGEPVAGSEYLLTLQSTGFWLDFYATAPIGIYELTYEYLNSYTYGTVGHPLEGTVVTWDYAFETVEFTKIGNSNSHLSNISFTSDAVYAGLNTILHHSYIDEALYISLLANPTLREIVLIPTIGINYNQYAEATSYYVVGQVANTDLTYFSPVFEAPVGAVVVRMNGDGTPADDVYTDFSPAEEDVFNFIWYRIYAEDYIEGHETYGTHFTDYRVAVQDVTNNIYLTVRVHMDATDPMSLIFLTFILNRTDGSQAMMSLFSSFDGIDPIGANLAMRATTSGTFDVFVDLPDGYTFSVSFEETPQAGPEFIIPESVIPRRYTIDIYVFDATGAPAWGQRVVEPFQP
ncbi:MAG TPA: hypothetical protein DCR44_03815 [Acholeplasmatales bacterium]|nr:MAG: hypothetical protein A2Y16_01460 [Tenericutes bacterium GWF2_57_13]HAQ56510.1 hypothetical protein [Acholeplasmatales bacterium]